MSRFEERDHSVQAVRSTFIALAAVCMGMLIAAIVAAPNWGGSPRPTQRGAVVQDEQGRPVPGAKSPAKPVQRLSIARGL